MCGVWQSPRYTPVWGLLVVRRPVMHILFSLLLPVALALLLLRTRQRCSLTIYVMAALLFLGLAVGYWAIYNDVYYYWRGPLLASGFNSWALPVSALSISAVCAFRTSALWAKSVQLIGCLILTNAWLVLAGWIA